MQHINFATRLNYESNVFNELSPRNDKRVKSRKGILRTLRNNLAFQVYSCLFFNPAHFSTLRKVISSNR